MEYFVARSIDDRLFFEKVCENDESACYTTHRLINSEWMKVRDFPVPCLQSAPLSFLYTKMWCINFT